VIRSPSALALLALAGALNAAGPTAPGPANVLVVVNQNSQLSKSIGSYYISRRGIPPNNVCSIRTSEVEGIDRPAYLKQIEGPIGRCLRDKNLVQQVLYIVTTGGVPLRIEGVSAGVNGTEIAAVDSELTVLYAKLRGDKVQIPGAVNNPFFGKTDLPFTHPEFPIYLVTRLAAWTEEGAKALVDRSLKAKNVGKFVIDTTGENVAGGDEWLKDAAIRLPAERTVYDDTVDVVYGVPGVIAYASWGSNDRRRTQRRMGFQWLPGAIVTEFVSFNGRTFSKPPDNFTISKDWARRDLYFAGAPQSLLTDYLDQGATGASGHVYEPYLQLTPRPQILLPAYYSGRNLAESYYLAIPGLSWQNIVVGDPLCSLGPPPAPLAPRTRRKR